MPNRNPTTNASGMPNMDWASEVNGDVVSYDDPAALQDNAANVRPASAAGAAMPTQSQRLTGGAESMPMPTQMTGSVNTMPGMNTPGRTVNINQSLGGMTAQIPPSSLNMTTPLPQSMVGIPQNNEQAYLGSLKAMLAQNLGNYISATFLVGTQNLVTWDGVLYAVGNDYLTIYQVARDRYIVCDYYSLKYMEFYDTKRRALCNQLLAQQSDAGSYSAGGF